ncbi:hypothetical protein GGI19_006471 [Coemansia pectinata]|nr:hypothetical protein GGI19_006471 [Coemansia pectinata]KAJ2876938.1 hypothetical protein GGH93_000313 [Coemansia aciculifera]
MTKRLRTRLRQARVTVERDLGHSLTAIAPPPEQLCHALFHNMSRPLHESAWSRMLSTRAHSYSHGDFMALHSETASVGVPSLLSTAANSRLCSRSRPAVVQRYQSAVNIDATPQHSTAQRLARASPVQQQQVLLHLPSSPSVPRTPLMQPLDSDNEVARTILMLATPPAARAPSLPGSSCQQPTRIGRPAARTGRRLSFSRCQAERPPKRSRYSDNEESPPDPAAQTQDQASATNHLTPNLSRIAALSQHTLTLGGPMRHAPGAASKQALAPPK